MKTNDFKKVINADGKMTILGVSTISDQVANAMKHAGQNFFVMSDFKEKINNELAKILKVKNLAVVNSASAGIALTIAALIYKNDIYNVNKFGKDYKREVILPKGQNVDYGAPIESMINLVGGTVSEAGWANRCSSDDVISKISKDTACLMYVVSHHAVQKNMLSLYEMIKISKEYNLPLVVDCASEADWNKYNKLGIDAVIFSGAKAFSGPTSGLVFGDNDELFENIKAHSLIIGRAMKIGKENIFGLYQALVDYQLDQSYDVESFLSIFKNISSKIKTSITIDDRKIQRIKLNFDPIINVVELSNNLKNNDPAIYTRDYYAKQNYLEIDLRSLDLDQAQIIVKEIKKQIK